MKTVILNSSIQQINTSSVVSKALNKVLKGSTVHSLYSFNELFIGEYITLGNATEKQLVVLTAMEKSDCLIFVVPTYYKSMPGALKNFFDIVRDKKVYASKTIAIIANNYKNQDYGAQHVVQVLSGLSVYYDEPIYIVPEILIVHHENIDKKELERFVSVVEKYYQKNH